MVYRLFLHKTTAFTSGALCIDSTNRTLESNSLESWKGNETENHMRQFDTQKVKGTIEKMAVDDEGELLCEVFIRKSPKKKIEYICITTSYDRIKKVISVAHSVAVENELVLYDATKKRTFHYEELCDVKFVLAKERIHIVNSLILEKMKPVWHIRKLGFFDGVAEKTADYAVTLKKEKGTSFEKRIEDFYNLLKSVLQKNEKLSTKNRCFTVVSDCYKISYTLEAYKKRADRIGYISDGESQSCLMYRMSCEEAFEWAKKHTNRIYCNLGFGMYATEMVEAFPNPADRFVKGIYILKQELKEKIFFSYNGYYGGAVCFRPFFPHDTYQREEISSLMIDDMDVSPLLTVISEFYPYIGERFYESNYLPAEMMRDILRKIKEIRKLIIHDTYSKELLPYIHKREDFFAVLRGCDESENKLFNENWMEFLYKHRYEAVRIYDIFIEWTEKQLEMYNFTGEGLMFEVFGP